MYRSLTDGILIMLVSVKRELNQTIYNLENRFEILTSGTMAPSVCTDNFITIWDQRNQQAVYINAKTQRQTEHIPCMQLLSMSGTMLWSSIRLAHRPFGIAAALLAEFTTGVFT